MKKKKKLGGKRSSKEGVHRGGLWGEDNLSTPLPRGAGKETEEEVGLLGGKKEGDEAGRSRFHPIRFAKKEKRTRQKTGKDEVTLWKE